MLESEKYRTIPDNTHLDYSDKTMTEHSKPENNTRKAAPDSRRRLLKLLGLGGAAAVIMPERWSKPIIDSVILPAHAQGTGGDDGENENT
ncbi:MAG: twin-arginine translocation signal domain-containing protein [Pseudomonadota bacterium]